jgi:hopanoid C-3 methylase
MRLLLVHPSVLLYSEIFLRLEPLGVERVAGAAREAGHDVRVVDLQVMRHADLDRELTSFLRRRDRAAVAWRRRRPRRAGRLP